MLICSLKNHLKFIAKGINYYLRNIPKIIPRKKNKWVFGEINKFRDNPKYLFYSINRTNPEINAIWIARDKEDVKHLKNLGYKAYYWSTPIALYHCATSKVWIAGHSVSNINPFLSGGAFFVNLWHGVSLKSVNWQAPNYYMQKYGLKNKAEMRTSIPFRINEYIGMFRRPDLVLAPSQKQKELFFAEMFDVPLDRCVVGVYPRSKFLIEGKQAALEFIKEKEPSETLDFINKMRAFDTVYIYMPTYRNDKRDFIQQAGIDWEKLNAVLQKKNALFILKFHPNTHLCIEGISHYSNICFYPSQSDIYTVLPFTDVLITDYSSVYSDFLMMKKEIILFTFDYDEYVENCNELKDYDKYYIGKRANDFSHLLNIISSNEDCHVSQEEYARLMEFFWSNNKSDLNIVEEVKRRILFSSNIECKPNNLEQGT